MKIAFVGLGSMGSAMARRLLAAGHSLVVYNRTSEKCSPLVEAGATLAVSPAAAARSADILLTMVRDDSALEAVVFGQQGALEALPKGGLHASMSTISGTLAQRLSEAHAAYGQRYVGAPVFGRPPAAAEGKLFILAAGEPSHVSACDPIFAVLAQKVARVAEAPSLAHVAKVLGNLLLFCSIEALAEAMVVARGAGLDAQAFLDTLTGTIFVSQFYKNYGQMMVDQRFPEVGAVSAELALKDVRLALRMAAHHGVPMPSASLVHDQLLSVIGRGRGESDVSVLSLVLGENAGLSNS